MITGGAILAVIAVVVAFVVIKANQSAAPASASARTSIPALASEVTSIPAATLSQIGAELKVGVVVRLVGHVAEGNEDAESRARGDQRRNYQTA